MTTGYVLFQLGESEYAAPLDDVREIVRLDGLERLPAAQPPLAGLVVLRGSPLPVFDVRPILAAGAAPDVRGDVLVMTLDGDTVGVAVDRVQAVLPPDALPEADAPARALPAYVVGVRRHDDGPVLLVDLRRLLDVAAPAI
jgi:purine-binding chemotaxis protein CheW